jgi:cytoskeletal protein RodZ
MELDLSSWMLIFFVVSLVVSIWKIYAFLPNKPLADDDTTKEAQDDLMKLVITVIKENDEIDEKNLYVKVIEHEAFDSKRFWRFNQNRLNQLLSKYYLQNEDINSIKDIKKEIT